MADTSSPKNDDEKVKTLVHRLSTGDLSAAAILLLHFKEDIRRQLRRGAMPGEAAWQTLSDLQQSVYRRVLEKAKDGKIQVTAEEDIGAWLRASARNALNDLIDFRRAAKRDSRRTESADEGQDAHLAAMAELGPARRAELRELADLADRALGRLDPETREVLELAVGGKSTREICSALGLDPSDHTTRDRIKKRVTRAKEAIRKQLEDEAGHR